MQPAISEPLQVPRHSSCFIETAVAQGSLPTCAQGQAQAGLDLGSRKPGVVMGGRVGCWASDSPVALLSWPLPHSSIFSSPFLGSRSVSTSLILFPFLHPSLLLTSCSLFSISLILSLFCPLSLALSSVSFLSLPPHFVFLCFPSISHPFHLSFLLSVTLPFPSLSLFLSCLSTLVTPRGWLPAQDWEGLGYEGPVRPGRRARVCMLWVARGCPPASEAWHEV